MATMARVFGRGGSRLCVVLPLGPTASRGGAVERATRVAIDGGTAAGWRGFRPAAIATASLLPLGPTASRGGFAGATRVAIAAARRRWRGFWRGGSRLASLQDRPPAAAVCRSDASRDCGGTAAMARVSGAEDHDLRRSYRWADRPPRRFCRDDASRAAAVLRRRWRGFLAGGSRLASLLPLGLTASRGGFVGATRVAIGGGTAAMARVSGRWRIRRDAASLLPGTDRQQRRFVRATRVAIAAAASESALQRRRRPPPLRGRPPPRRAMPPARVAVLVDQQRANAFHGVAVREAVLHHRPLHAEDSPPGPGGVRAACCAKVTHSISGERCASSPACVPPTAAAAGSVSPASAARILSTLPWPKWRSTAASTGAVSSEGSSSASAPPARPRRRSRRSAPGGRRTRRSAPGGRRGRSPPRRRAAQGCRRPP